MSRIDTKARPGLAKISPFVRHGGAGPIAVMIAELLCGDDHLPAYNGAVRPGRATSPRRSLTGRRTAGDQARALTERFCKPRSIVNHFEAGLLLAEAKHLLTDTELTDWQTGPLFEASQQLSAALTEGRQLLNLYQRRLRKAAAGGGTFSETVTLMQRGNKRLDAVGHLWPGDVRKAMEAWLADARTDELWVPRRLLRHLLARDNALFQKARELMQRFDLNPDPPTHQAMEALREEVEHYITHGQAIPLALEGQSQSSLARLRDEVLPGIVLALANGKLPCGGPTIQASPPPQKRQARSD